MKYWLYSIVTFSLLLWSCSRESDNKKDVLESHVVQVNFSVDMPDYDFLRAENESSISRLELWVFNESGIFLQRSVATLVNATETGKYNFTAQINQSSTKRIIHFIANHTTTDHEVAQWKGREEGDIVPSIQLSKDTPIVMWQRKVFAEIQNPNKDLGSVVLLRNKGKFMLEVANDSGLTDVSYALHNYLPMGTIAPFSASKEFTEGVLTPSPSVPVMVEAGDFVSVGTPIYAYEQSNQKGASAYPYIIIKAKFVGHENLGYRYFKLDLVDPIKKNQRYDIKRNWMLKIKIKKAKGIPNAGHTTLEKALSAIPDNNFALSEELQPYPSFSDGEGLLKVEKTNFVVVNGTPSLEIKTNYYPDKNNPSATNNSLLDVERVDPSNPVITNASIAAGVVTLTLGNGLDTHDKVLTAEVIVKVIGKPDLQRLIRVHLRDKYKFASFVANGSTSTNGNTLTVSVPKTQNTPLSMQLTLPEDLSKSLLPLQFRFYTENFYPTSGGIVLGFEGKKTYWSYVLSAIPNDRHINVTFKSNRASSAETIKVEDVGDMFHPFELVVTNP